MDVRTDEQHIADRLAAAVDTDASAVTLRQHLERASRPSRRFIEAMRQTGI